MVLGAPELDAATAEAIAGEFARASRHSLPLGAPCPNCAAALKGPWCHSCGQKAERFDRSIAHLAAEAFEGLTHLDGRVWRTLPRLVLRPGQLTRDYLDGRRASQIPPFRLFLVALLLVFFTGGLGIGGAGPRLDLSPKALDNPAVARNLTPQDRADVQSALDQIKAAQVRNSRTRWWMDRAEAAHRNPEALVTALEQWGHRLAILMLPVAALMLTVLFASRKDVYVFDHLVFSMHSLAFQGFLVSALFLGGLATRQVWWLLWASPVHLFFHMRGTYSTGVLGALVRMGGLFVASCVAVLVLLVCVLMLGLASLR